MKISFFGTEKHFIDHLAPVYKALEFEKVFYGPYELKEHARTRGIDLVASQAPLVSCAPVVVASHGDNDKCRAAGLATIFCEHGVGQTYTVRHPSFAGGTRRDNVLMFLCPNDMATARNVLFYPEIGATTVGIPKLDELAQIPKPEEDVVAVSFHWDCKVVPETRSAFDHYKSVLKKLHNTVKVIGHCHPRNKTVAGWYKQAGIEYVEDFYDVVRRATVYVCDNSSTIFEWAALGRPVVLLNSPHYRREMHHGLRFWSYAHIGINVWEPEELVGSVLLALEDEPEQEMIRDMLATRVCPYVGTSVERAVKAIVSFCDRSDPYDSIVNY